MASKVTVTVRDGLGDPHTLQVPGRKGRGTVRVLMRNGKYYQASYTL